MSDMLGETIAGAAVYSDKRTPQAIRQATCFNHEHVLRTNRVPTAVGSGGNAHGNAHRYRQ
jgi:hypothetical protein